ncbi:MAG: MBOAT family protein [Planctomycetota bacterium]
MNSDVRPATPARAEWLSALIKATLGATLLWALCPLLSDDQPLAVGWAGMVGLILLLHFGVFHLLALSWRSIGIDAQSLFESPALATSLAGFWGGRWNRAFRDLTYGFILRPLARRIGTGRATMAAFIASGLVHDLVISIPAGGGYGLPTAYFALQGLGLLVERSRLGARLGLRRGWRGWLFMAAMTAGPVFWLFHPRFVERVVVPFLVVIGAA